MEIVIPVMGFGRQGGSRVLSNLANEWIKLGHTVRFLCPQESDSPYFPTKADIIWLDRAGKRVPTHERCTCSGRLRTLNVLRSLALGLRRYAKDADIVLANHNMTVWPVFWMRLNARKYYYVQAYEPEYYSFQPGFRMRLLQALCYVSYMLPLETIVNAPVYLRYKVIRARAAVPPGIDFKLFYPTQKPNKQHGRVVIGCIGRSEEYKGTKYVYDAYRILAQRGVTAELRVAFGNRGDSGDPNIHIIVPRNDNELGDYYRSLDVLVAPGTVQLGAAHYPVMEAMACGIPVVTTGYLPADNHNSWIVPVHNANAIADAVSDIMGDREKEASRINQALTDIQQFTWAAAAVSMLREINNEDLPKSTRTGGL